MKKVFISILVSLMVLSAGCIFSENENSDKGEPEKKSQFSAELYEPLKIGITREYEVSWGQNDQYVLYDKYMIIGTKTINKKTYYIQKYFKNYNSIYAYNYIDYIRISNNILCWGGGSFDEGDSYPEKELPLENFNVSIGETWEIDKSEDYKEIGRILGIETIEVPAGVFENCLKLETIYIRTGDYITKRTWTSWLAPGVGLAKITETLLEDGVLTGEETSELISYYIP